MSTSRFLAWQQPSDAQCAQLETSFPTMPYYTQAYRDAMQACGREVWLLGTASGDALTLGCLAEIQSGRLSRGLHIQSTPDGADDVFWEGMKSFCKDQRITTLSLGTVGTCPDIPMLGVMLEDKERQEYWVDLDLPDPKRLLRGEQRRIFNRATDAGMAIRQVDSEESLRTHNRLTAASLGRRRGRGEEIPEFADSDVPRALLDSGVGCMFECVLGDAVLGSVILTLAKGGAHGYSAGYAPEGLKSGAGVFTNLSTFYLLKEQGRMLFNLGDAPPGSGLALFKKGLGGVIKPSRSARFHVGGPLHRSFLHLRSRLQRVKAQVRDRSREARGG